MVELERTSASETADEQDDGERPPACLQEELADLLVPPYPRLVLVTHRRLMLPYYALEQGELEQRLQAGREHADGFDLWLRALALYRSAFDGVFDWGEGLPIETVRALNVRADLLGLAGSSSKPTLDALLAGYYWNAFGLIRNLLETWRRAAFVRRRPEEAVRWFVLPDESPIGADGRPRKGRKSLTCATIQEAFKDATGDDKEIFDLVNVGIAHFHGGAHPSAEGMVQLWAGDEGRRVFGPTYNRHLCAFGLKWGLTAHVALLREVNTLRPQGGEWVAAYNEFFDRGVSWQHEYNAEFADEEEDGSGSDASSSL